MNTNDFQKSDRTNPSQDRNAARSAMIETVLFYLMTRHARDPRQEYALAIVDHLEMLMDCCPAGVDTCVHPNPLCQRLLPIWRGIAATSVPGDDAHRSQPGLSQSSERHH